MEVLFNMVDRVDLLIAVIGIVVSVVGSSTALWIAISKKADKGDLDHLEARVDTSIASLEARVGTSIASLEARLDTRISSLESRLDSRLGSLESRGEADMARIEAKLDGLILRLVPDGRA